MPGMVIRSCAAVVDNDCILMVFHRHGGRAYWTLPGGGVEEGETPQQAAMREVKEETGLDVECSRFLFDEPFDGGICRCFLMTLGETRKISLGHDPEEAHLKATDRMLQGVAWHQLESMKNDGQVSQVIKHLSVTT